MSTIGWIDFSTNDRNRVGSILDLMSPEGMVDELGLGTIRDSIANQLFPGISTIQTAAKYFFTIPYILYAYQKLSPAQQKKLSPSNFLENKEYELMWALAEQYNHKVGSGVIGISKHRPNKIARRPSAIYWNGLFTYKFIDTQGLPAETFLKQAANPTIETLLSSTQQGDDTSKDDADADYKNMFKIKVPRKIGGDKELTLDLDSNEAEFFFDRITSIAKGKLIAELLGDKRLWEAFLQAKNFMQFAKASVSLPIKNSLKETLILAHDFSELMYGAHIAYNRQLQSKKFNNDSFSSDWNDWVNNIQNNMLDYSHFDPNHLFLHARTTRESTVRFVKDWWSQTLLGFPNASNIASLIQHQEGKVKGGKARLKWNKTDDVQESHWIGLTHFDYRFTQGRRILNDIKTVRPD